MGVVSNTREDSTPRGVAVRTFLISDIRGYSTFTDRCGDESAARLATRFAELARDAVEARGGSVIELRGDEALAVFDSAAQAVRAGLELQEACREATRDDPDLPLPVGIGLDCGEAVPVEDGYRGVVLNTAARLCSKAAAGQVLVTAAVAQVLCEVEDVAFESLGAVELKGFELPIEVLQALSTRVTGDVLPEAVASRVPLPPELDASTSLAEREHELRWLRGTWRQVRRGHGRIVVVSGPAGMGKTRLAAELATLVETTGAVRYVGAGGAGGAEMLAAIADAATRTAPTLWVLDDLSLYDESIALLSRSVEAIESRPVLVLGLFREAAGHPGLAELVDRIDGRGDGHRRLGPLGLDGVAEIARSYTDRLDELPAESMLRASGGVPARLHEVTSSWTRDEAKRRLAAAAEWLAAAKSEQAAGLDFADNVIALKLGRIHGAREASGPTGVCPYKGLAAFEQADAPSFYGRERLVGELAARTVGMGLLGVAGPSGSGKSSVVMAGLLPSLAADVLPGSERWRHAVLRPGDQPAGALDTALLTCAPGERIVVVVDQFEEVFTSTTDESDRAAFIGRLVELARDPERALVVVTIRGDYTDHCAAYPEFAALFAANLVLVAPMTHDELRRAIELPARRAGLHVESSLGDAIVGEVGDEPGGLPLLSTALVELWQAREDGWLRLETYERSGGVRGAVSRLAEASFEQLSQPEREAVRVALLRLVGEGEGESAVRRRVPISDFDVERDPVVGAVLSKLTADRLLTRNDGTIELAHEALVREWPRLRGWLEDDVTGRHVRAHLAQAAKEWAERGHDAEDLYRGARLTGTLDWAQQHERELNALERDFLARSREASERDAERQRRTNRRLRGLLIGTAVFLAVAILAGSVALLQRGRARDAQAVAEAQALRSDAERLGTLALSEPNLDRAMLLAVAGVQLKDLPETRGHLLGVLQKTPAVLRLIRPSRSSITALAVAADGSLLASGDSTGAVRFHALRTWKQSGRAVQLDGQVSGQALAFSPDGGTLAVATATGAGKAGKANLHLVDTSSRRSRLVASWPSIPSGAGPLRFTRLAFAPDGKRLAVAVMTGTSLSPGPVAGTLFLLDARSGREVWRRPYPIRKGQQEAHVAFGPDGTLVSSASQGETVVWNATNGRIAWRFPVGGALDLSPDGHLAALALNNPTPTDQRASLALLDLRTRARRNLHSIPVSSWISTVEFTPDGTHLVGRSLDGVLRVWDLASGSIVQTLTGQATGLTAVVVPDGRTALSGAADGRVVAWDLSGAERLGRTFRWRSAEDGCPSMPCFVVDPRSSGKAETEAQDLSDGRVALVDLGAQRRVAVLPARSGPSSDALAFFPDGRTLATGGSNGNVTLWDVRKRSALGTLHFAAPVSWVAVSPGGHLIAVQTKVPNSSSSRVEVRDLRSGEMLYRRPVPYGKGGLEFSPDGSKLAALGCCKPGSTIEAWAARSGKPLFSVQLDSHATSIAFSPDGRLLGAGTLDGRVVLLSTDDGTPLGSPLQVATLAIDPISFSPDGRLLVASSIDGTATLWDLPSRKRLGNPFPIEQGSNPIARFAPDGDVVIDNLSETAQWPTNVRAWKNYACQVAGRELKHAEWDELLPDRTYRRVCRR